MLYSGHRKLKTLHNYPKLLQFYCREEKIK